MRKVSIHTLGCLLASSSGHSQRREASSFFSARTKQPTVTPSGTDDMVSSSSAQSAETTSSSSSSSSYYYRSSSGVGSSSGGFTFQPLKNLAQSNQNARRSQTENSKVPRPEEAGERRGSDRDNSPLPQRQQQQQTVRTTRRRRIFQRPVFAEMEDAEGIAETAVSATVTATTSLATSRSSDSSYSQMFGKKDPRDGGDEGGSAQSSSLYPGKPYATYEEAEAAILDQFNSNTDPSTLNAINKRISQAERFADAHMRNTVTDDDPILKVLNTNSSGGLGIEDDEEAELREVKDAARRDRIRVEGTTGMGGVEGSTDPSERLTLAGTLLNESDRIPIQHRDTKYTPEEEEARDAKGATVSAEMLTPEQKHLLWEDRKKAYSLVHRKILIALESHHDALDKLFLLMELHDIVIKRRLLLRADIYTDIFATAFTALTGPQHYTSNNRTKITMLDELWVMYTYAVDSGVDPTRKMIKNMMRILSLSAVADPDVEAKAHKLMVDSDRFKLIPTPTTLSAYYTICGNNNAMHLAVARLVDAKTRLEVFPNSDAVRAIICGFRKNGQADKGLTFLSTISNITITMPLFSEIIHTAKESSQPLSAFTFYRSLRQADIRPDVRIIASLLVAMEYTNDYSEAAFVLREVMRHRVRLEHRELNRMLVALEKCGGLEEEFCKLFHTMQKGNRPIFFEKFSPDLVEKAKRFSAQLDAGERVRGGGGAGGSDQRKGLSPFDFKGSTSAGKGGGGRDDREHQISNKRGDAAYYSVNDNDVKMDGNLMGNSMRRRGGGGFGGGSGRGSSGVDRDIWRASHDRAEDTR